MSTEREYPAEMPDVPTPTDQQIVEGTNDFLPSLGRLSPEFVRERHPACLFVLALMSEGKLAFERFTLMPRYPLMTQGEADRAVDAAIASIRSSGVGFSLKVAGTGYFLDTWFTITRNPEPQARDLLRN